MDLSELVMWRACAAARQKAKT
ncbi:hypothetical protein NKH10_19570 [Mesorhizobium sp. M1340]